MTFTELVPLISQYRAGLDGELVLLRRLEALSLEQREASTAGEFKRITEITDERDRLMATLVTLEAELKPIRLRLFKSREKLQDVAEFREVIALHQQAAALVNAVLSVDEHSLEALKQAEIARRTAAQALEQGESTLAAYRRVVAPATSAPALVNRRG
jgi:hypothetical protein